MVAGFCLGFLSGGGGKCDNCRVKGGMDYSNTSGVFHP